MSCHFIDVVLPRVLIFEAEGAQLLQELPLKNIIEIGFSPAGTFLSTWERPGVLERSASLSLLTYLSF